MKSEEVSAKYLPEYFWDAREKNKKKRNMHKFEDNKMKFKYFRCVRYKTNNRFQKCDLFSVNMIAKGKMLLSKAESAQLKSQKSGFFIDLCIEYKIFASGRCQISTYFGQLLDLFIKGF